MYADYFFGTFQHKCKDAAVQIIDDIYCEPEFARFYEKLSTGDDEDIKIYLEMFDSEDRVLEIGTGNGRVLKPLLKNKIDIYGIEPAIEMLDYLSSEERSRVEVIGIEDLTLLKSSESFSHIIIPATSICLFDFKVFTTFLLEAKSLLKDGGKIIFDFLNPTWIQDNDKSTTTVKLDGQLFISGNFVKNDQFIYNIYTRGADGCKKLGYSIKNIYSIERIQEYCQQTGYTSCLLKATDEHILMEVTKHEP